MISEANNAWNKEALKISQSLRETIHRDGKDYPADEMNNEHKSKGTSITEAASKMVSEWSHSKKAAFEQRTGLIIK